jgi:hypothetical protein
MFINAVTIRHWAGERNQISCRTGFHRPLALAGEGGRCRHVKNFTNFSCGRGGRLLNNALGFSVRQANFNW